MKRRRGQEKRSSSSSKEINAVGGDTKVISGLLKRRFPKKKIVSIFLPFVGDFLLHSSQKHFFKRLGICSAVMTGGLQRFGQRNENWAVMWANEEEENSGIIVVNFGEGPPNPTGSDMHAFRKRE